LSAGAALSSTDSATFLTFSHLLPVASVGVSYHTDARHTVRLALDLALAPYVDTYVRTAYQRATARAAAAWSPSSSLLVDLYLAGAIVPYTAGTPDSYGTAGGSVGWSPGRIFTVSLGGFTQSQFQSPSGTTGGFRQWTAYLSVTLRDRLSF
jgi:hypothetical protein